MRLWEAIRAMIAESGKNAVAVSTEMGRSRNYIGSSANRNQNMGTETLAEICDACGYDLVIRNTSSGAEFVVDVPERVENDDSSDDSGHEELVASVTFTKTLASVPETCSECPFATICDDVVAKITKNDGAEWTRMAKYGKPRACPMKVESM